ncbi:hypothetical protein HOD29_06870 [archaeon]|jgi:hypothetical protein|nr:hypothetical protein [archaeon]
MEYKLGKNCYLFHSMIGTYGSEFTTSMRRRGRDVDSEKFFNFYHGGDSVGEVEKMMGLDVRDIMCCASKKNPAVVYHRSFGLILSGEIKSMFDNDSGLVMFEDGAYATEPYYKNFTKKTNLQTLMTTWYDKFSKSTTFNWNEVILNPGSKIVGAFHDPSFDPKKLNHAYQCTYGEQEYFKFLEKADRLGLNLVEINAKFR